MLDAAAIRDRFPALMRQVNGRPAVYLDGPGGTQVPQAVIDAMSGFMTRGGSNLEGPFVTSIETGEVVEAARRAGADLLGAQPSEIVFGQNMTSLTFSVSRALAATWEPGDNIVVTNLDHDANITPWVMAAADNDLTVHHIDFRPDGPLDYEQLEATVGPRTRLVAATAASNALGTRTDVARIAAAARSVGALSYIDGVHNTPHSPVDVSAWDCDFYVCSSYKFFGPHTGMLFGKQQHLGAVDAYKVRASASDGPGKWETGTQAFESLAGVTAAVDFIAALGEGHTRRRQIVSGMAAVEAHGDEVTDRFLSGIAEVPGVSVAGVTDGNIPRTPTFAVAVDGVPPHQVAATLGNRGIFAVSGHYYAVAVMQRLGFLDQGGLTRLGFVAYNTLGEVDVALAALADIAAAAAPSP
jgi:cysteine desulfurase family protein (TIGR01976 family)